MPVNQREEALVLASQNSDTNAFEELYQLYYDKIYALIMMTVKNSADTEDILQLTFIKAWQNIAKLNDPKAFNTWLQRIALNESKSMLRKKRPELSVDDEGENGEALQFESDMLLPQEYAERDDLSARLRRIIEELSVVQRDTILLYYYNDMSVEEIAQIMECSEGTVKSRLHLARKAIKTEIEEQERKSGEKFYGAVLMPFGPVFNSFVRSQALSSEAALRIWGAIHQSIAGAAAASAAGSAATTAVAKTGLSLGAKIAIGVIAGIALIGGAAFGISQLIKPQEPAAPAAESTVAFAEQADETQEAAEETQAPATEAPTEADYSEAFQAYLTALKQAKWQINEYDWQSKRWDSNDRGETRPVAFADVCGDGTPEMIYAGKRGDSIADFSVITYLDGPFTPMKDTVDAFAAAGTQYYLFTVEGDKALYCYNTGGDQRGHFRINRYSDSDEQNGVMKKEEYLYRCEDETGTITLQKNGEDVAINTYNAARSELLNKVDKVLMKGTNGAFMEDDVKAIMESKENISMTYEEAVEFLGGKSAVKDIDKPDYTMEDLNVVKGKYNQYYRPGLVEITSDGKLITHSIDFRTGEETEVNTYQIIGIKPVMGGGYNVGFQKDGEQDYLTVYMKGDVSPGGLPSEYIDSNNCLNTQLFLFSNKGVPFIYSE